MYQQKKDGTLEVFALCYGDQAGAITVEQFLAGKLPKPGCTAELSREEIERRLDELERLKDE